ncbi:MAG: hypothetical protein K6T85_15990, partial [Gorillibacterium sp.]|nr:hypothetical protein [Gorillibacterium sp.]
MKTGTSINLGAQMFTIISSKVLMLLDSKALDISSFAALLTKEGVTDIEQLRDGFLQECAKHHLSVNEAQYLFSRTKYLLVSKMMK